MAWSINTSGRNRFVLLTRRYALKIPSLRCWQDFLYGLLNNCTEARVGTSGHAGVCPVLWSIPGGWLVVMPRLQILKDEDLHMVDVAQASTGLCVELKPDSFGLYQGRVVAVDYGWGN